MRHITSEARVLVETKKGPGIKAVLNDRGVSKRKDVKKVQSVADLALCAYLNARSVGVHIHRT